MRSILAVLTEEEGETLTPDEQLDRFDQIRKHKNRTPEPMPEGFLQ